MSVAFYTPTRIVKNAPYITEINFLHLEEVNQETVVQELCKAAALLVERPGFVAVNVLRSTDGSRVCTYVQWKNRASLVEAHAWLETQGQTSYRSLIEEGSGKPRLYDVHYTHDVSPEGHSVISRDYKGVIFINEITTIPGPKQFRLLELVIANNEKDSLNTPGYRSANFHRSIDGERAVNYSLWDSEEHLIEAVSAMAGEDVNLEETVEIASPDFRFYTLAFAAHQ
jgi:heme-degrading monooxygenase HmoA